jgi:pyrroloquinoline quinone biosynthesis protein D
MSTMKRSTPVQIATEFRFQWEEAQQCFVLLYPEGMIQLNPSAGEILKRCQQPTTIDAVIKELEQSFPDAEGLDDDVIQFFQEVHSEGWLNFGSPTNQERL